MTGFELCRELSGEIKSGSGEKELRGCYIGDLLSLAMSRTEEDNVWITVQTNINIVAVATLTEVSAILLTEGVEVDQTVIEKAEDQGINILRTSMSSYEAALAVGDM